MKLKLIQHVAFVLTAGMFLAQAGGSGCSTISGAGLLTADPNAVVADYGDAPDGLPSQYPSGITARFPTQYVNNGAHHLDVTDSAFGPLKTDGTLSVSAEKDATDKADPDGIQNIDQPGGDSDHDAFDDGLTTPMLAAGGSNKISFLASVAAAAPKQTRYVNMLADWDQNGAWSDSGGTTEWIVQNMAIDVDPGTTALLTTPEFLAGATTDNVWLRMTMSDTPIDATAFATGWDGTGEFAKGETEDYLLRDHVAIDLKHIIGGGGPGGGGPGGGGPGGGGPGGGGPGGGGPGGGGPGGGGTGGGDCEFWRTQQATICVGSSRTFLATIGGFAPDSVTASSSDPSVAGVSVNEANVTVTGESEGTATIDVTVEADGCIYHVTVLVTIKKCGPPPKIDCCSPEEIAKDPSRCDNCHVVGVQFYDNETPAGGGDSVNGGIEQTGGWGNTDANNPTKSTVVGVGNTVKIVVTYYDCDPCDDEEDDCDGDGIPNEQDWFPNEAYDMSNPHDFDEQIYVDSFFDVFFDSNNDHEIFDQMDFSEQPTTEQPTTSPEPTTPTTDPYHPYDPYMYEKY
jgi:GEVED domain-containing protein/Big-like domain-containing protein